MVAAFLVLKTTSCTRCFSDDTEQQTDERLQNRGLMKESLMPKSETVSEAPEFAVSMIQHW